VSAGGLPARWNGLARGWMRWRDRLTRRDLPGVGQDSGPGGFRACAADGVRALHRWYDPATGLWRRAGWWNAANALNAVIQYTQRTGDRSYAGVIETTFGAAGRKYPGFINGYYDDNGWWALSWVAAFDLTRDPKYLAAAEKIFEQMTTGWDGKCGGGLWWTTSRTYKNAIPNELFLLLAGRLHQRAKPGPAAGYLDWALREWKWFAGSGMIGASGLVNDGLTADCANNGGTTWSYNQGVILGGLAVLHEITGDEGYLDAGNKIAGAALRGLAVPVPPATRGPSAVPPPPAVPVASAHAALDAAVPGMLVEPCEGAPGGCNGDQVLFKGIFIRNLYDFYLRSRRDEYRAFILANAHSIWQNNRDSRNRFGLCWGGPFDRADASRQTSALDVLNAALALTGDDELLPGRLKADAKILLEVKVWRWNR